MNGEPTLHTRTAADWRAWLDEHRKRDGESFYRRFTPRRPRSNWSSLP